MRNSYVIGIDIGGTNTDAVLVDQNNKIISSIKATTTEDISQGFSEAITQLLQKTPIDTAQIKGVFVGTTHAINAILQKKDLFRVGVIRIAGQMPEGFPVAFSWPQDLREAVIGGSETINGGLECYGSPLTPFCNKEAAQAIQSLLEKGVESIAIVGVFSPLSGQQERDVAAIALEIAGKDFPLSISCEIGGIGFIERENSTILNASLKKVMQKGFLALQTACEKLKLSCPLMVTQNDGSLIDLNRAIDYPVLTISAGATNSFIGAARLALLSDAIVVDIGGTSTDVGYVRSGFPVRSLNKSNIGGVLLNFPMPDVLSIGLGGGSIISFDGDTPKIGPKSVGKFLTTLAQSFGGNQLTLTDAALMMKYVDIPEATPQLASICAVKGKTIFDSVQAKIEALLPKIQGEGENLPVIFVGGGAGLLPPYFFKERYSIPSNFNVANAYGAALAEISGSVDTVVSLQNREGVLDRLYAMAKQKAIDLGADPATLRLIDQQIIPYSYVPNQMARVIVKYCGKCAAPQKLGSGIRN